MIGEKEHWCEKSSLTAGIEPATSRLTVSRSTNWAKRELSISKNYNIMIPPLSKHHKSIHLSFHKLSFIFDLSTWKTNIFYIQINTFISHITIIYTYFQPLSHFTAGNMSQLLIYLFLFSCQNVSVGILQSLHIIQNIYLITYWKLIHIKYVLFLHWIIFPNKYGISTKST